MINVSPGFQTSKFRAKATNVLRLRSLFYEHAYRLTEGDPLYTLKDNDRKLDEEGTKYLPSLYRLYMEEGDLTEYIFANKYLEDWNHWQRLCNCNWFKKDYLPRWRKELELKVKAEALNNIRFESRSNSKNAFAANKYLFERGVVLSEAEKTKTRNKAKVTETEVFSKADEDSFDKDLKRLGIEIN